MKPEEAASRHSRIVLALAVVLAAAAGVSAADRAEPLPKELEGVGITQRVGDPVPLDLTFTDEQGATVRLRDFFRPGRPVILDLGYYRCPMLCNLVLNGLVDTLGRLTFEPGRDYELVMVSIDPQETPELARAKKQKYLEVYGKKRAEGAWHFLVGGEDNITALATAVGFSYRYVPDQRQYAHTAGLIISTPEGTLSRYLLGIQFEPRDLRLALAEASSGKVGSVLDQVLLFCFHYDASAGQYTVAAARLMRVGGAASVIVLGLVLASLWWRERRRRGVTPGVPA